MYRLVQISLIFSFYMIAACNITTATPVSSSTPLPRPSDNIPTAAMPTPSLLLTARLHPYQESLEIFFDIFPGQTSQEEVIKLLGEADGHEEPLLDEQTWLYLYPQISRIFWRISFNTTATPNLVSKVRFYPKNLSVSDLIQQFGTPAAVYQVYTLERDTDVFNYSVFAYPEQGIYAYLDMPSPQLADLVTQLYRESPQSLQSHMDEMKARSNIRIIEWP